MRTQIPPVPSAANPFDLSGRLALVTGSTAGLGYAIAEGLGKAGARIVLNGRDPARVGAAAAKLRALGVAIHMAPFDVTDRAATEHAMADIAREAGPLDILVNNAGINQRKPLEQFSDGEWQGLLAANLDAPFRITRSVLAGMKERRRGCIINICSIASELGRPGIVPYAVSKGGLQMLTRALAVEVAPFGLRVNGIAPGFFATPMNAALTADADFDAWVRRRAPAGRWGEPAEIAGAAVFLACDAASYVTGHILYVDGGFTASY